MMSEERKVPRNLLFLQRRWIVEPSEEEGLRIKPPEGSGQCTGCRLCEAICSFGHFGVVSPSLAAIKISKAENDWVQDKTRRIFEQKICKQCTGLPACMAACPKLTSGALYRDPETKAVLVNHETCIKCKACLKACPYDAIRFCERTQQIVKCDLCGGHPKCVEWCPQKILRFVKR